MSQHPSSRALPAPSADAAAHSARLAGIIRTEIENHGPMGFDRFMTLALYAPGLGYYSTGLARFGAEGDFITAPEISPLFGRCLARQCAEVLERHGGDVFELGAGNGTLAAQVLRELAALEVLPEHYYIFEPSAGLRERQRTYLREHCAAHLERIQWLEQPPGDPFNGVVLANEVVDALPAKRFRCAREGITELKVRSHDRGFAWIREPADLALAGQVRRLRDGLPLAWPDAYQSELHVGLGAWLYSVSHALRHGLVLLIDYGYPRHEYYHPERSDGTLVCHYRHRAHDDPFLFVGLQDITAFVDFTAVAEAADQAGLEVTGFTSQGAFLLATGIAPDLETLADGGPDDLARLSAARRLIAPADMGERFKVMALSRGYGDEPPLGFRDMDLREQLLPPG